MQAVLQVFVARPELRLETREGFGVAAARAGLEGAHPFGEHIDVRPGTAALAGLFEPIQAGDQLGDTLVGSAAAAATGKRARVLAALRGDPVDRVPLAFWLHNFAAENSAAGLAAETLRLARTFDWDYLKPQSRAQCFAEMWGLTYRASNERAIPYTVTHQPVADAADLRRLQAVSARTGALVAPVKLTMRAYSSSHPVRSGASAEIGANRRATRAESSDASLGRAGKSAPTSRAPPRAQ